jgi:hypothetical protein
MGRAGLVLVLVLLAAGPLKAQSEAVIESEVAPARVERPRKLGTHDYTPTAAEKPFLKQLPAAERRTGSIVEEYSIQGKKGKSVSWFGIVRSIKPVEGKADTHELVIEHKYFDGMTDTHILAVSFNGSGDFKVVVHAKGFEVGRLSLVRVYGTVSAEVENVPVLDASYVRIFPWRTFTFIAAYGEDRSNSTWRQENKVDLDKIYDPAPDDDYYRRRLGEP